MHLVGLAHDRDGTQYFVLKDSYGELDNENGGMVNMSESYMRAKTVTILVHKDAIPVDLQEKLGISQKVADH